MTIIKKRLRFGLLFLLLGCSYPNNNVNEKIGRKYYDTGELKSLEHIDSLDNKLIHFIGFYKNGNVKEMATYINDSLKINEHKLFFSTGEINEYNFYNPFGERRYSRLVAKNGQIIREQGDFICYVYVNSKVHVGDSSKIDFFIANPPGCKFKIFGVNKKGKYRVGNTSTSSPFKCVLTKKELVVGKFVFPYEIEFHDTINNFVKKGSGNINYEVTDK